jgi:hypothetical protein
LDDIDVDESGVKTPPVFNNDTVRRRPRGGSLGESLAKASEQDALVNGSDNVSVGNQIKLAPLIIPKEGSPTSPPGLYEGVQLSPLKLPPNKGGASDISYLERQNSYSGLIPGIQIGTPREQSLVSSTASPVSVQRKPTGGEGSTNSSDDVSERSINWSPSQRRAIDLISAKYQEETKVQQEASRAKLNVFFRSVGVMDGLKNVGLEVAGLDPLKKASLFNESSSVLKERLGPLDYYRGQIGKHLLNVGSDKANEVKAALKALSTKVVDKEWLKGWLTELLKTNSGLSRTLKEAGFSADMENIEPLRQFMTKVIRAEVVKMMQLEMIGTVAKKMGVDISKESNLEKFKETFYVFGFNRLLDPTTDAGCCPRSDADFKVVIDTDAFKRYFGENGYDDAKAKFVVDALKELQQMMAGFGIEYEVNDSFTIMTLNQIRAFKTDYDELIACKVEAERKGDTLSEPDQDRLAVCEQERLFYSTVVPEGATTGLFGNKDSLTQLFDEFMNSGFTSIALAVSNYLGRMAGKGSFGLIRDGAPDSSPKKAKLNASFSGNYIERRSNAMTMAVEAAVSAVEQKESKSMYQEHWKISLKYSFLRLFDALLKIKEYGETAMTKFPERYALELAMHKDAKGVVDQSVSGCFKTASILREIGQSLQNLLCDYLTDQEAAFSHQFAPDSHETLKEAVFVDLALQHPKALKNILSLVLALRLRGGSFKQDLADIESLDSDKVAKAGYSIFKALIPVIEDCCEELMAAANQIEHEQHVLFDVR